MVRVYSYLFALVLLFLVQGCGKDSVVEDTLASENEDKMQERMPIVFSQPYTAEVKASELKNDNITSFGVYAALATGHKDFQQGASSESLQDFMTNIPVTKNGSIWSATPSYYWPNLDDKSLSFFAYAPHNAGGSETALVPSHNWDNASAPFSITYTPKSNPASQVDLCVASAVFDRDKTNLDQMGNIKPVEFSFAHTLSWVSFAANYTGTIPEGCYLRVDELSLYNVVGSNTISYVKKSTAPVAYEWEWSNIAENSTKSGRYMLSIGSNTLSAQGAPEQRLPQKPDSGTPTYYEFVNANGYIYGIPQEINPEGATVKTMISITFSFVKDDASGALVAQFYSNITLPSSTESEPHIWEPARKVKYLFTIDVTTASLINISKVDAGAWIIDWESSGNDPDYDPTDDGENDKEII